MPIPLNPGDEVSIEITVEGGNNDIEFYIKDPGGRYVRNPSKIYSYYKFSFTATEKGTYELWFDNSFSLLTSKYISLEIIIRAKGTATEVSYPIFTQAGIALIAIGVIIAGVGIVLKPRKA